MNSKEKKVDKFFLVIVSLLLVVGIAMFLSASFGVLVKDKTIFYSVLTSQLVLGLGIGLVGMFLAYKTNYKLLRSYSFYIFLGGILVTAAVFIPHLGWSKYGAERWPDLGFMRFQPVEILKFSFVVYFAAWLSWAKNKVQDFRYGILPLGIMLAVIAFILFNQPDTKSFILIAITGICMLFFSGSSIKNLIFVGAGSLVILSIVVFSNSYIRDRLKTYMDPDHDPKGKSYQIQQSLIAIGSGGILGRGYGQSIQKFGYLPEAQGDSIFAVIGEELGFVGAVSIIILYILFALRGFRIANNSPDQFSRLLVSGIVILITAQSFMNIASITGVFPLTGVPLVFISHGGTSLMIDLIAVGIILQISKFQIKKREE